VELISRIAEELGAAPVLFMAIFCEKIAVEMLKSNAIIADFKKYFFITICIFINVKRAGF
jgi:hypothetical protein